MIKKFLSFVILLLMFSAPIIAANSFAQSENSQQYFGIYYIGVSGGSDYVTAGGQTFDIGTSAGATFCYIPALNVTFEVQNSQYSSQS